MTVIGQQLISLVRAHAAQRPDFVYQNHIEFDDFSFGGCVYVESGCASCLIGQALFDAGLINANFENDVNNDGPLRDVLHALNITLDPEELQWLTNAQHYQDSGEPWGEAVRLADQDALAGICRWSMD